MKKEFIMHSIRLEQQNKQKSKGYNVLLLDGILDAHFISTLEQKYGDCQFARVDSASIDKLIEKEEESKESKLNDEQKESVKKAFEEIIDMTSFNVEFSNLSEKRAGYEHYQYQSGSGFYQYGKCSIGR